MRYKRGYKRILPEEPDWRTREKRGNTGFSQMKTEREKRMEAIKFCQRCFSHGHFTYECKNERIYQQRPSETQMLKHPKLAPVISLKTPPDLIEKREKEREKLLQKSEKLLKDSKENANDSESYSYSYSYSYSDYSYSYSDYSEAEVEEGKKEVVQEDKVIEKEEVLEAPKEERAPIPLLKKRTNYSSSESSDYSGYSYSEYSYSEEDSDTDKSTKKESKTEPKSKPELKRRRYSSSEYSDYSG